MSGIRPKKWLRGKKDSGVSRRLVTVSSPFSAASEAYRTLRTSLLYAQVDDPPKVIVVTSPGSAEGKSSVCANLGVVLAQAGKDVLVLDCDFRRPVMHQIFDLPGAPGVVDVLLAERSLQNVYQTPLPDLSLKVLTVGATPPNPAELMGSGRLSECLERVREQFDYVLVDSSPTGLVSDPLILAAQADGVVLVLDAQKTSKGDVRGAVRRLTAVGANVLGTVLNNAAGLQDSGYYQAGPYPSAPK